MNTAFLRPANISGLGFYLCIFYQILNLSTKVDTTICSTRKLQVCAFENYDLNEIKPSISNPIKWSNTLKQFFGFCRRIV